MPRKPIKDKFVSDLEAAIKAVLDDPSSESKDRINAINAGVKLAMVKHKVGGSEKEGSFFD